MGLLNLFFGSNKQPQVGEMVDAVIGTAVGSKHETTSRVSILPFLNKNKGTRCNSPRRLCRVEQLEERQLLAADINFGAVYHENNFQNDLTGDTFHVTWEGGEVGTQLEKVVISLDKNGNGKVDAGESFFHDGTFYDGYTEGDKQKGSAAESFPFEFVSAEGFDLSDGKTMADYYDYEIIDNQTLVITFKDFKAGNGFVFMIDVDEVDEVDANGKILRCNAVVEGAEFHGSKITGTFEHENYHTLEMTAVYQDEYPDPNDPNYQAYLSLDIPNDDYVGQSNSNGYVATAGGFAHDIQKPLPVSISGHVYEDNNQNNVFDSNETGINDVSLELFKWDATSNSYVTTSKTTKTINNGYYEFEGDDLLPGKYRIVETQPNGYQSVNAAPGKVGSQVRGQKETVDILTEINLLGGENSINNDFGEVQPGKLSGYVYEDDNDNGIKDPAEAGINNVSLELFYLDAQGNYVTTGRTTKTGTNGYYEFAGIDPKKTYKIVETQPSSYIDGKDTVGTLGGNVVNPGDEILGIYVDAGSEGINYNFGELRPSSLSGYVAVDKNNNNVLDANDEYLVGVTLQLLDKNGTVIATTQTVAGGYYIFDNLKPGEYQVKELQPEGYYDGPDFVGTGVGVNAGQLISSDTIGDIVFVVANTHGIHYDFLEYPGGCIEGYVYEDDNNNGIKDTGEAGIVTNVTLWDGNTKIADIMTDENGYYRFCDLEPNKEYTVKEDQPEGYCDGKESQGTVDGTLAGDISVNDVIAGIPVKPGIKGTDFNFGELKYSSISGYVYHDLDNDGVKETGESGIKDVVVELWVWDESLNDYKKTSNVATTDENGYYEFTEVCPYKKFRVIEIQPEDYISGKNSPGTPGGGTASDPKDWITDIELTPDQHSVSNNFGELKAAKLSGYVYADVTLSNGRTDTTKTDNGSRDDGEKGIPNITVHLYVHDGTDFVLSATTTTNGDGYYEFAGLLPGKYKIVEEQPEDYFDGKDSIGTLGGVSQDDDDLITNIIVQSGANGVDYNFGELIPAKITGYVFQDGDVIRYTDVKPLVQDVCDGVRDDNCKPLAGITLVLCNAKGDPLHYGDDPNEPLITVTTDANGYYEFDGLAPESYAVREIQPSDYEEGINTPGDNGGLAQSPGRTLQPEQLAMLAGNDSSNLIYMINVNFGEVAANNNFSEVLFQLTPPTPPPPPSTVEFNYPGPPQMPLSNPNINYGVIYTPPTLNALWAPGIGGGGLPGTYAWHLSVINAGYPRSVLNDYDIANGYHAQAQYTTVAWQGYDMSQTEWSTYDVNGKVVHTYKFGPGYGVPVAGDFSGDGIAEIAIFCDGIWHIDLNGNGSWDDNDLWAKLGSSSDQPVVGDWDGDGKIDIGVFGPEWPGDMNAMQNEPGLPTDLNQKVALRPKNMPPSPQNTTSTLRALKHTTKGRVRLDVIDHVFRYGAESDRAVSGDFNGDGITEIGVYRNGTWYIDYNGNGQWDSEDIEAKTKHSEGDIPIVGDFTGEGVDRIGLYTPSTGRVIIDTNGDHQLSDNDRIFYLEGIDDVEALPVIGDINGDGIDEIMLVKHLNRIPMQTRLIPSTPTPMTAPVAPSVTSDASVSESQQYDFSYGTTSNDAPPESLDFQGAVSTGSAPNMTPPSRLF